MQPKAPVSRGGFPFLTATRKRPPRRRPFKFCKRTWMEFRAKFHHQSIAPPRDRRAKINSASPNFLQCYNWATEIQLLAMIDADDPTSGDEGRIGMYSEVGSLVRLLHQRQQRAEARRPPAFDASMPRIKMIVSDWYTDELGNQARIIRASD